MSGGGLRLDKWLWYARFCKSRSVAGELAASGRLRCNGGIVAKAHFEIAMDDVLTFPLGRHIRVVKVLALGQRRGPAAEARALYQDLAPPAGETALPPRKGGQP